MNRSRFLGLAACQWLVFQIILLQCSDKTVEDLMTPKFMIAYAIIQIGLHWNLWKIKNNIKPRPRRTSPPLTEDEIKKFYELEKEESDEK